MALPFALYATLAVVMTWPLALAPARLGIPNMDALGNIWAMAWVAHQGASDPARLFDSNMFHPHPKSLAYAESLIPQALLAAPMRAAGGSPLLAYNVVLLFTFTTCGLGAHLLARDLGAGHIGAALAGVSFAFNTHRWDHFVHLQTLSTQWLPLALLCARRLWRGGGLLDAVGLTLFTALQCLSSGYFALLMPVALGLTLLREGWESPVRRRLVMAVASLGAAGLLMLPVFAQYRAVRERHGLTRARADAVAWSARPASYLEPGSHSGLPHLAWLHERIGDGEPLYPGLVALVLGGIGLLGWRRDRAAVLAGLWLCAGFVLSLGPEVGLFGWRVPGPFELLRWLPGGTMLRTPSRLGVLALLGLAVLAGLALTRLARGRRWLGAALVLLACLEAYPADLRGAIRDFPAPPATARWLASAPRGVVLELPWNAPTDCALYLYWSTAHWQPMINGFGSFDPPGSFELGLLGNRWPSEYSARVFRAKDVRYVVVHLDRLTPPRRQRLLATQPLPQGVELLTDFGEHRIYGIGPGLDHDQR